MEDKIDFLRNVDPQHYFVLEDGRIIKNLQDLAIILQNLDDSIYYNHVTPHKNDFAAWIYNCIGDNTLTNNISHVKDRNELMNVLNNRINELKNINQEKINSTQEDELTEGGKKMFSFDLNPYSESTNSSPSTPMNKDSESLEEKLKYLLSLKDKGLIPEKIYLDRVSKLI